MPAACIIGAGALGGSCARGGGVRATGTGLPSFGMRGAGCAPEERQGERDGRDAADGSERGGVPHRGDVLPADAVPDFYG